MIPYESDQFEPPAPVARVTLRNPDTDSTISEVPMLLDTGADVSLIPRESVNGLNLSASEEKLYELVSFDGTTSLAPVVKIELVFCNRTFKGQFLLLDRKLGILGRNVLNSVSLVFDGPNFKWYESRAD